MMLHKNVNVWTRSMFWDEQQPPITSPHCFFFYHYSVCISIFLLLSDRSWGTFLLEGSIDECEQDHMQDNHRHYRCSSIAVVGPQHFRNGLGRKERKYGRRDNQRRIYHQATERTEGHGWYVSGYWLLFVCDLWLICNIALINDQCTFCDKFEIVRFIQRRHIQWRIEAVERTNQFVGRIFGANMVLQKAPFNHALFPDDGSIAIAQLEEKTFSLSSHLFCSIYKLTVTPYIQLLWIIMKAICRYNKFN